MGSYLAVAVFESIECGVCTALVFVLGVVLAILFQSIPYCEHFNSSFCLTVYFGHASFFDGGLEGSNASNDRSVWGGKFCVFRSCALGNCCVANKSHDFHSGK